MLLTNGLFNIKRGSSSCIFVNLDATGQQKKILFGKIYRNSDKHRKQRVPIADHIRLYRTDFPRGVASITGDRGKCLCTYLSGTMKWNCSKLSSAMRGRTTPQPPLKQHYWNVLVIWSCGVYTRVLIKMRQTCDAFWCLFAYLFSCLC